MNRLALLRVVNMALLVSFIAQAVTSIILFFGLNVPGLKMIMKTHIYNGLFMVALAATHIILNWGWINSNFLRKR